MAPQATGREGPGVDGAGRDALIASLVAAKAADATPAGCICRYGCGRAEGDDSVRRLGGA